MVDMREVSELTNVIDFDAKPTIKLKDTSESAKHLFVDFYADWCGPCKAMANTIKDVEAEFPNVDFVKINVEMETALSVAQTFGVTAIPTCYIIAKSGKITKHSGALGKTELSALINSTIQH